ncbi:hypothetical protein ACFX15_041809 [Malus domestica]
MIMSGSSLNHDTSACLPIPDRAKLWATLLASRGTKFSLTSDITSLPSGKRDWMNNTALLPPKVGPVMVRIHVRRQRNEQPQKSPASSRTITPIPPLLVRSSHAPSKFAL